MNNLNKRHIAALIFAVGMMTAQAAPAQGKLPESVEAWFQQHEQTCTQSGGEFDSRNAPSEVADLNGDGRPDYILSASRLNCKNAESVFSSAGGGSGITVIAGTADGKGKVAFNETVHDFQLDKRHRPARLYLTVGGSWCGQQNAENLSRPDIKHCQRPLRWNRSKQIFEFAPLSAARPVRR